jgi:uncharacterized protein
MQILKVAAIIVIIIFLTLAILLYAFQTRLIFFPGKLSQHYKFRLRSIDEEIFITTEDREKINALFFKGAGPDAILYFHGNAGDLSGWQFVAQDFVAAGFNILLIDYRGYGKSTGSISENGFYLDADAAYNYLIREKGFEPKRIIIYGRSVGTGVAVEMARKKLCKGLILESPYSSLRKLANEKVPFFFPSLYMRYSFNNLEKINEIKCPIVFLHGNIDEIIPAAHSKRLFEKFKGKKRMILIKGGSHNDLNSFDDHKVFINEELSSFFPDK